MWRTLSAPLFPYTTLFRSKGLGEMSADQLKQTTLDPKLRMTLRVTVPSAEADRTDEVISELMGKDVAARFKLITEKDRKSTRLNSSHLGISYAVFCLKKKT